MFCFVWNTVKSCPPFWKVVVSDRNTSHDGQTNGTLPYQPLLVVVAFNGDSLCRGKHQTTSFFSCVHV